MEPIITVSGLRGEIGVTLTPIVAAQYVAAYSACCSNVGPMVIANDGRGSASMLTAAVRASLHAAGRSTIDCGVCATPTVGVLIRTLHAAGGIQISASHNPSKYNGLKLFSAEGRVIPAGPGAEVLAKYHTIRDGNADDIWAAHDQLGTDLTPPEDTVAAHLQAVLETIDADAIRKKQYRVLLDSNHGAGGKLGRRLLESLGCNVILLGEKPTGLFTHTPEPTEENLKTVLTFVTKERAAVGFCQDPDADRLAVIDENGRYIGEEYTVAICTDFLLKPVEQGGAGRKGAIVTNCSTSRMTQQIAETAGGSFSRSKVGEANVVDEMLAKNALFGGEGNGGPIDPRVGLVRDSFVGMGLILNAMAAGNRSVSKLADEIPARVIVKTKLSAPKGEISTVFDLLEKMFPDAIADRLDGLRLDWPNGNWLLLRASNTEPIVRAIAEATKESDAKSLCDKVLRIISDI